MLEANKRKDVYGVDSCAYDLKHVYGAQGSRGLSMESLEQSYIYVTQHSTEYKENNITTKTA